MYIVAGMIMKQLISLTALLDNFEHVQCHSSINVHRSLVSNRCVSFMYFSLHLSEKKK